MVVSSVGSTSNTITEAVKKQNTLDMEDFLNLLIMQLKNQDPIEPMDNSQFLSQMAQFNNLEMMGNMTRGISDLTSVQKMVEARQLIGRQVDYFDDATQTIVRGVVTAVETQNNAPVLVVGGATVAPSAVVRVSATA